MQRSVNKFAVAFIDSACRHPLPSAQLRGQVAQIKGRDPSPSSSVQPAKRASRSHRDGHFAGSGRWSAGKEFCQRFIALQANFVGLQIINLQLPSALRFENVIR